MIHSKRLFVAERDVRVFRYLFNYKVMTVEQIWKYPYKKETVITNVRGRLRRLEIAKYVSANATFMSGKMLKTYSLRPKGLKELLRSGEFELVRNQLGSNSIIHDLTLVEIGEAIKRSNITGEYLTENEIQCIYGSEDYQKRDLVNIRSDATSEVFGKDTTYDFAIEYEHSENSKKKYQKLVRDYYWSSQVDGIFFFYNKDWIRKTIEHFEEQDFQKRQSKFYFFDVRNGFSDKDKITFESREKSTITI